MNLQNIDFKKGDGLVPCIVQNSETLQVLMLGYMNEEALTKTLETKQVTFFSRSKNRLWTKGEESGNFLNLLSIELDCDGDTLLCKVLPNGPTCHKGTTSCWNDEKLPSLGVLSKLEQTIKQRWNEETESSYVATMKQKGLSKIAQKVGEEAVEVVIEALKDKQNLFLNESADLLFHFLLLLRQKNTDLNEVLNILKGRMKDEK